MVPKDKFHINLNINIFSLKDLLERELQKKISPKIKLIELAVICSDVNDDEKIIEVPRIRLKL